MNILILENAVQGLISSICDLFRIYFLKNVFDLDEKSEILNHENLNKKTLETISNEILFTDVDENEQIIKNFKKKYNL